jgi:hypothetical protein
MMSPLYNIAMAGYRYLESSSPRWAMFAGKIGPAVVACDTAALIVDSYQLFQAAGEKKGALAASLLGKALFAGHLVVPKLDAYFNLPDPKDLIPNFESIGVVDTEVSWERPRFETLHQWIYTMRALVNLSLAFFVPSKRISSVFSVAMQVYCLIQTSRKLWIMFERKCSDGQRQLKFSFQYWMGFLDRKDGTVQVCKEVAHRKQKGEVVRSMRAKIKQLTPQVGSITPRRRGWFEDVMVYYYILPRGLKLGCPDCLQALQEDTHCVVVGGEPKDRAEFVWAQA